MIYHITTEKEWAACEADASYIPGAFEEEGFIHASDQHQLDGVLNRYYRDRTDLILLVIDEKKVADRIIYEASTNGEKYPHIYGRLNKDAIVKIIRPFHHADERYY
jgi:uncharacterized protein (DUF952 family)